MPLLVPFIAGMIFGAGLVVSQMTDPLKVLGFLDVAAMRTGNWDPTLLLVFAGALPVMYVAYGLRQRMAKPALGEAFHIPANSQIDARLVGGSALFGVGWGLAGICPGPSIAVLSIAGAALPTVLLFIVSMLAGMLLLQLMQGTAVVTKVAKA